MRTRIRHIHLLLIVAGLTATLSGCQNRKGMFGSDNWNRNGFANTFLNGNNPYLYAGMNGQVVGYLVAGNTNLNIGQQNNGPPIDPQTGGVKPADGTGAGAGGVFGGATAASQAPGCTLKIAAISPENYYSGSNQNFAGVYHETGMPSSGRGIYQTGVKFPVTCDKESEVAATQSAFYVTGGATSNFLWAFRTDSNGAPRGQPVSYNIGPSTKISASPSGHIAVITNGGRDLTLFFEGRIGGDGGWVADKYHSIPAQNGSLFTDVAIDDRQGAIYVGEKIPGGQGRVSIYRLTDAYNGVFRPAFDSMAYLNHRTMYNFESNLPNETAVAYLFRQAMPLKVKNNNGLTGIFTTAGHPFFMETGLGLSPEETASKTPEQLNEIYQNNRESMTVQDIRVFDPFQVSYHTSSSYVQPAFKYKDFAIGNNMAYLITEQGTLYSIYVSSDYQFDASTPWENRLNMGMRLNSIEMSYDLQYAIVTGSSGLSIGRVSGNNLIFSSTGRPDIQETAEIIHAAGLAKINKIPLPQAPAADAVAQDGEKPKPTS